MTCILAVNKLWYPQLAYNISKKTQKKFIVATSPAELTKIILHTQNIEYIFFPHWSYIIPAEIYNNFECIVFHMTDLPFGRGGSPLQNLISRKIYETQISAFRCEKEVDAGPIYLKKPLSLQGSAQAIYQNAALIIEEMIVEIIQNELTPIPQEGEVVHFLRRKPEESNITSLKQIDEAYDYIRMLDAEGYPNAFIETDYFKLEFSQAEFCENEVLATVKIKLKKELA